MMNMSAKTLRILGFEGFDGGSHRAVRESISRHSRHKWAWLTRPGRAWKWRMRLGAVELIEQGRELGVFEESFEVVFVTSMISASDLQGMLPTGFRDLPLVVYMHENQVAYPVGGSGTVETKERDIHFAITNLTSVLAADLVLWNSKWNRDSFLEGIEKILRKSPDGRSRDFDSWLEQVRAKSVVCWPPVEPSSETSPSDLGISGPERESPGVLHNPEAGRRVLHNPERGVRVVWPHRWEHDKGVDELFEIAERETKRLGIRWTILGEQFGRIPEEMRMFEERFEGSFDHIGFKPDRGRYWEHLARCDWVLSTARHEFFGIAVVEAMLAGCLPWLPERLSYPELLPECARVISPLNPPPPDEFGLLRAAIRKHLEPCVARNAVARLDRLLEAATEGSTAELNPPTMVR